MATDRRATGEPINAFPVGHRYLFKQYFERRELFERLERFYREDEYRFEVRADDLAAVESVLAEYGYTLVVIEDLTPFTVAVRKYSSHPENAFADSVARREDLDYHLYLMKDRVAVEEAVRQGAIQVTDLDEPVVF